MWLIDNTESLCAIFKCCKWLPQCVSLTALSLSALSSNVLSGYHSVARWQHWVCLRYLPMCYVITTVWLIHSTESLCAIFKCVKWLPQCGSLTALSLSGLSSNVLRDYHSVAHSQHWVSLRYLQMCHVVTTVWLVDSTEYVCAIFICIKWLPQCGSLTALSLCALSLNVFNDYRSVTHSQH